MIDMIVFLLILLGISIYLLIKLWNEKEGYRKWFEASKDYETYTEITSKEDLPLNKWCKVTLVSDGTTKVQPLKFNKDGSIAKKRGPKAKKQS